MHLSKSLRVSQGRRWRGRRAYDSSVQGGARKTGKGGRGPGGGGG
jgi:hypothetical protein